MRDCQNAELRDLLPDLAADRLSGLARDRVVAHVARCPACTAEVDLLRRVSHVLRGAAPVLDVGRIVAALPSPRSAGLEAPVDVRGALAISPGSASSPAVGGRGDLRQRSRATWTAWRLAAAISTIAVGGLSVAMLRGLLSSSSPPVAETPAGRAPVSLSGSSLPHTPPNHGAERPVMSPPASPRAADVAGITSSAATLPADSVSDLSDGEVEGLLNGLDDLEASPSADPEPAAQGLHEMGAP